MPKCLCTISNDSIFKGTETLLKSFLKNNSWFTDDIIILYSINISPLSDENKTKLTSLYQNIKFIEVNEDSYNKISNYLKRVRFNVSQSGFYDLFKYEIFSIKGYERLVYLDKDCLVLGDVSEIFNQQHDFVVTQETKNYPTQGYHYFQNSKPISVLFNSGVFSIGGAMFNYQITNRLQHYTLSKPDWETLEQTVMNDYFKNSDIQFLHNKFNTLKVCFQDSAFKKFDSDIRVIRYIGEKPWQKKTKASELVYQNLEKLWLGFNNIDISNFIAQPKSYSRVIDNPRSVPINPEPIQENKSQNSVIIPINSPIPNVDPRSTQVFDPNQPHVKETKFNPSQPLQFDQLRHHVFPPSHNIDINKLGMTIVNIRWLSDLINGKRVCLVANSNDLLSANLGEFIDSHDVVIRCNSFPINKPFTGEKTDIHVMYYLHNDNLDKFVNTRIIYSPNLINWKNYLSHKLIKGNQQNILDLYWPMQNGFINRDERLFPTTGFNTLRTICTLKSYQEFNLIAFNFYEGGKDSIYRSCSNTEISKTHNYQYEKDWIMKNAKKIDKYIISL